MDYVSVEKQVNFVAYKLKGGVTVWLDQLQITRVRQGKPPVMTGMHMKLLLRGRFFPPDYQQILYILFEYCQQGTRTVMTYTEEFYRLSSRCDLSMTEEKQAMKYISGLKYSVQESDPSRCVLH